jgi:hypothetical protein
MICNYVILCKYIGISNRPLFIVLSTGQSTPYIPVSEQCDSYSDAIALVNAFLGLREPPLMACSMFDGLMRGDRPGSSRALRKALQRNLPGKKADFICMILISYAVFSK